MCDTNFMREALDLARRGMGFVSPNPLVGAVIVRDGEIIGRGWHKRCGDLHAERNAFKDCDSRGISCEGADMYVTLEPCCHYGRTPPCTEAVIEHGIKRVFIGSSDPNPLVSGKGVAALREHGIEVTEGVLREECDALNEIFFHYITTKRPFVTLKYAMTLDGKIACFTGQSKWITGGEARMNVQRERLRHSAIMVGIGTVLADDPMLTCRLEGGRDPLRVICDSSLRIPLDSNIVQTARSVPTLIAACITDSKKKHQLEELGCRVIEVPQKNAHTDLGVLFKRLGEEFSIDSVLIEGGAELAWSALSEGLVNKVQAYIAPKLFGGTGAKSPVGGAGVAEPSGAFRVDNSNIVRFGDDIMIEGRVRYVHGDC